MDNKVNHDHHGQHGQPCLTKIAMWRKPNIIAIVKDNDVAMTQTKPLKIVVNDV